MSTNYTHLKSIYKGVQRDKIPRKKKKLKKKILTSG